MHPRSQLCIYFRQLKRRSLTCAAEGVSNVPLTHTDCQSQAAVSNRQPLGFFNCLPPLSLSSYINPPLHLVHPSCPPFTSLSIDIETLRCRIQHNMNQQPLVSAYVSTSTTNVTSCC